MGFCSDQFDLLAELFIRYFNSYLFFVYLKAYDISILDPAFPYD